MVFFQILSKSSEEHLLDAVGIAYATLVRYYCHKCCSTRPMSIFNSNPFFPFLHIVIITHLAIQLT